MASKLVDYRYSPYKPEEKYGVGNYSDLAVKIRSLKEDIRSCKANNKRIIETPEKLER